MLTNIKSHATWHTNLSWMVLSPQASGERLVQYWCVLVFIVQRTRFKQNSARTIVCFTMVLAEFCMIYTIEIFANVLSLLGSLSCGSLPHPPSLFVIILTSDLSGRFISLWHLSLAVKRLSAINEHRVTNSGRRNNSINFRCNYLVLNE